MPLGILRLYVVWDTDNDVMFEVINALLMSASVCYNYINTPHVDLEC